MFLEELERFEHVHVHVVARLDAAELRGTVVFELLKRSCRRVGAGRRDGRACAAHRGSSERHALGD
jgi:hypothetical protein